MAFPLARDGTGRNGVRRGNDRSSANPAASGRPGINQAATKPTINVVKMTSPTDKLMRARRFARKSMNDVL